MLRRQHEAIDLLYDIANQIRNGKQYNAAKFASLRSYLLTQPWHTLETDVVHLIASFCLHGPICLSDYKRCIWGLRTIFGLRNLRILTDIHAVYDLQKLPPHEYRVPCSYRSLVNTYTVVCLVCHYGDDVKDVLCSVAPHEMTTPNMNFALGRQLNMKLMRPNMRLRISLHDGQRVSDRNNLHNSRFKRFWIDYMMEIPMLFISTSEIVLWENIVA